MSTGEAAIEYVDIEQPDLLIVDVYLSGELSGIEAVREIRKKFDIPVIFISGGHRDNPKQEVEALTASLLLLKPFGADHILGAVHEMPGCRDRVTEPCATVVEDPPDQ